MWIILQYLNPLVSVSVVKQWTVDRTNCQDLIEFGITCELAVHYLHFLLIYFLLPFKLWPD